MSSEDTFVNRMKKATRKSHAMSDKLINAKLALSINSDDVWAEGLIIFYEIFKFLENAMTEKKDENLGKLMIDGLARTQAFEKDLIYYLGGNWKISYQIRDSVAEYLAHMQNHLDNDPDMLIPYVYHLYMGLMSGGQLLMKKRDLENIFLFQAEPPQGEAVTNFAPHKIWELKAQFKATVNAVAENIDEDKKVRLINEGNKVFELNNAVLKTMASSDRVLAERIVLFTFGLAALLLVYYLLSFKQKIIP